MKQKTIRRVLLALLFAAALSLPALAEPNGTETEETGAEAGRTAALETPDIEYERREEGFTADFDYSGVLDYATGLPTGRGSPLSGDTGLVYLTDGMSYDASRGRYVYPTENGTFYCTAADGMVVTQPVSIETGDAAISVYRDGAEVTAEEYQELALPGEYVVYAGAGEGGGRAMTFTVVGRRTNRIYGYSVPEGFFIRDATWNGEDMGFDRYFVNMEGEGDYAIEYRCPTADLTYTLEVTIDRTPPQLTVDGKLGDDGRVHSAVTFLSEGEEGTVSVLRDGDPYKAAYVDGGGTLSEPGVYELTITDEAGNSMTYPFEIMVYLDSNSILFILLVLATVGAVIALAVWKRKNFRTY